MAQVPSTLPTALGLACFALLLLAWGLARDRGGPSVYPSLACLCPRAQDGEAAVHAGFRGHRLGWVLGGDACRDKCEPGAFFYFKKKGVMHWQWLLLCVCMMCFIFWSLVWGSGVTWGCVF
jgi:hypothetical protein